MGRPEIEFNWGQLQALCERYMRLEDCAEIMQVSDCTINRNIKKKFGFTFEEYRNKKLARVRLSLVQKIMSMANGGNLGALIFCLKNICQWSEKVDSTSSDGSLTPQVFVYIPSNGREISEK